MKIAVTGASGFVGGHVISALIEQGAEVTAYARDSGRIRGPSGGSLRCVDFNLAQPQAVAAELARSDVLVHLAWEGLPNYRSATHVDIELPRQRDFLDACIDAGVKRLVVAGTCLEYGLREGCLDEDASAEPVTAYASAKLQLQRHLARRSQDGAFEFTWLRLFYLFGPGQASGSLYSQLRAAIESGAASFPMSPGNQKRDFIPVERAAALIGRLAATQGSHGIVNLCSGTPRTVLETARGWLEAWGADVPLKTGVYPYPDYEPRDFWGSTRKLDALLGTP